MNYKSLFLFALLFFLYLDIYSTHIRAGEIVARRISTTSLTYEFTVIGYTDTGSEVEFGGGEFSFGDGNFVEILDEEAISSQKQVQESSRASKKHSKLENLKSLETDSAILQKMRSRSLHKQ